MGVTRVKTLGGGAQNRPRVLGALIYEGVRKRGEDWFESFLNIRTPLSPNIAQFFLIASVQLNSQKKNYS